MSKTAPQRGRHTVARHGALKSPHPFSVFMKALGIVVAVVLVSGTGVAAYTVYDLAASYATENTVELEEQVVVPPDIGAIEGGVNLFVAGTDACEPEFAAIFGDHAEGSPYAVASGEDALMLRLSALAPGPRALVQMGQAYDAMSLAAAQERTRGPVSGSVSEGDMAFGGEEMAEAELSVDGVGGGGALGGLRARRSAAPAPSAQATREAPMDDAMAEDRSALDAEPAPPPEPLAAMASRIRERFPATLHFEAGRPLDGAGATLSFPLADALTTYRVEAIAWTASGWTTTASTEVRVDQRATVDAPVPPFAAVGDTLRLPLRVDNRSGEPLQVQLAIEGEGVVLAADAVAPIAVEARRGVEVRVLLPGESDVPAVSHASRRMYGWFMDAGVHLHEWRGNVLHAKTAVVDERWTTVGTYNLDHRSWHFNLEVTVAIEDEAVGRAMRDRFFQDLAQAPEVDERSYRYRPMGDRLLEHFFYLFRKLL